MHLNTTLMLISTLLLNTVAFAAKPIQQDASKVKLKTVYEFSPDYSKFAPEVWKKRADEAVSRYKAAGGKRANLIRAVLYNPYSYDNYRLTGLSEKTKELFAGREAAAIPPMYFLLDNLDAFYCGDSSSRGDPQGELVRDIFSLDPAKARLGSKKLIDHGNSAVKINLAIAELERNPNDAAALQVLKKIAAEIPSELALDDDLKARLLAGLKQFSPEWLALKKDIPARLFPPNTTPTYGDPATNYTEAEIKLIKPRELRLGKPNLFHLTITNKGTFPIKNIEPIALIPAGVFILAADGESNPLPGQVSRRFDTLYQGETRTIWFYALLPEGYPVGGASIGGAIGGYTREPNGAISGGWGGGD